MKKIVCLIAVFLWVNKVVLIAQIEGTKYTLETLTNGSNISNKSNAFVYSKRGSKFISIQFSDGLKKAELLKNNSMSYKFQISEIRDTGIVTIQFIGNGTISNKIAGTFNYTIDGLQREDMSGDFTLIKDDVHIETTNKIGGHIGVVHGLFMLKDGKFTLIIDDEQEYSVGFPVGITVKRYKSFAFDIELVPFITFKSETKQDKIDLLIHPGFLWGIREKITFGTRLAFELGDFGSYGFTPLFNFGVLSNGFMEIVFPIRFSRLEPMSVTVGVHFGVGF